MWRYLGLILVALIVMGVVFALLRQIAGPGVTSLIWLVLLVIGIVVIVRNLASNRKVTDASAETRTQALAFAPESGKAALYLIRTQFVGKAVGVNVEIDGKPVAQLKSPRFTRVLLSPGAHRISGYIGPANGRKPGGELDIDAAPGEIISVMCEVEPGMIGTISKFKRIDLAGIRERMQKTRMVQPDVAEI